MALAVQERRMPLIRKEGPLGLIICPSRELARQTWEQLEEFANEFGDQPKLRTLLLIGGVDGREQVSIRMMSWELIEGIK